jgi:hypothetical protein
MTNVNGVNIELPDGTVFEFRGDISLQAEQQAQYLVGEQGRIAGFAQRVFDEVGSGDILKTPMAGIYLGAAGGQRRFEIAADNWEGEIGQFGAANNDDSVLEKLAVFENALASQAVGSLDPALLEYGPYSQTSSRFDAIPVVFPSVQPSVDFSDGPSVFRSRFTALETIDLSAQVDGGPLSEALRLTPESASTPRIPIPLDTLGAIGGGRGEQTVGNDVALSGLVDPNGSGKTPTSAATKILPERVSLSGLFRGQEAASLADQLKADFLKSGVDAVEVEAPGLSRPTPLTGVYTLGPDSAIFPVAPQVGEGVYGFRLDLREK